MPDCLVIHKPLMYALKASNRVPALETIHNLNQNSFLSYPLLRLLIRYKAASLLGTSNLYNTASLMGFEAQVALVHDQIGCKVRYYISLTNDKYPRMQTSNLVTTTPHGQRSRKCILWCIDVTVSRYLLVFNV